VPGAGASASAGPPLSMGANSAGAAAAGAAAELPTLE